MDQSAMGQRRQLLIADSNKNIPAQSHQVEYLQFMRSTYGKQNLTEIAEELGLKNYEQNFTEFQKQYDKRYYDGEDLELRRANFLYSLKMVKDNENDFKTGRVPYRLKINKFADFGMNEKIFINQKLLTAKHETANKPIPFTNNKMSTNVVRKINKTSITFPAQFDWRSQSMVTPIEDQGQCGSSWIFAGVGLVESANAIAGNPLVVLSKQQVLDCVLPPFYLSDGCNGGMLDDIFHYTKQVGLTMEKTYPYKGKQEECHQVLGEWREWIYRYNYLPLNSTDEMIMWFIYNKGPVAALINAGDRQFQLYSGGILTDGGDRGLDGQHNQYVQIIGWGNDNGLDFWMVKNSWGRDYGESGYVKMIRGVNNRGINTVVAYVEALPIRQPEPPRPTTEKPEPGTGMTIQHSIPLTTLMLSIYKNTFQIENLFKLSKMARQQSFILLWALLMIVPIGHSQTLPPNVTNILNQLLEQSLADQQQDINGDSSSLTPTNLAEIVRIFVQFLVAIFNAFQRIFAQSPMLRNDVMYKSWSDQDFAYNPNISFEKVLQDRKEKFNQIFNTVQRFKRGAGKTFNMDDFSQENVENLLEQFLKNINGLTRIKRNVEQFINRGQFDNNAIEKLLNDYVSAMKQK
ncbi:group 1 mite allergen-like protein [Dermatophagoides farinae]|uniref:Group 1 mite allergen-like protein n=1 Tax=Dermatophagoides farinae TaxID=6954 RepID=A0A9D4NLQ4_DERFA|nr:group 1 mite allergen-like protein [Dermatophagoides farinae]